MRTTLCKAFLLHLPHVENSAQRLSEGLYDADDDQHHAAHDKGRAGVGGPDDVSGHFKGQVNKQLNECAPCAQRDKSAAEDVEIAAAQIVAKRGHGGHDQAKGARYGKGKGQKPIAVRFCIDIQKQQNDRGKRCGYENGGGGTLEPQGEYDTRVKDAQAASHVACPRDAAL